MEAILRAASRALGRELVDAQALTGSPRTSVLRCRAGSDTVIVKAYKHAALASFAAEAAGLSISGRPGLLAVDRTTPLIVMQDVGEGPSLADLLLGADARDAEDGLLAWAGEYGRLAAETADAQDRLAALRAEYDLGVPVEDIDHQLAQCYLALPRLLRMHEIAIDGLDADLAVLSDLRDRHPVFSPGDVCPDNNVIGADRITLLDYEGAGFRSVFLDAAYTAMPFSTCWCVFRLPEAVRARVEATYRAAVAAAYPELLDDAVWRAGLTSGAAAWAVHVTVALLDRAVDHDQPMHPTRQPVPSMRQLLRFPLDHACRSGRVARARRTGPPSARDHRRLARRRTRHLPGVRRPRSS